MHSSGIEQYPDERQRGQADESSDPPASPPVSPLPSPAEPLAGRPGMVEAGYAGLSQDEAEGRVREVGFNEIPEESLSPLRRLLLNFWGPIPWMLEGSALLALLLGAWGTLLIILGNLGLNALVAFWEELRANQAIAALRERLTPRARVRRGGDWRTIAARELAPGDLIHVRLGDVVPADARMLTDTALEVDRSLLTGESLPIECAHGDLLHAGSIIRRGEADAVVEATGRNIHFATTIQLVQKTKPVGHLQHVVVLLGRRLLYVALALDALILVVAAFRRGDMAATLEYALLLAVASVPVAMPTVFSVTMAVGAQRLARMGVLVSRLSSVEELAAMDRLCVDKTGTLTQNALTAGTPFCMPRVTVAETLLDAALASRDDARDPIDQAVLDAHANTAERSAYEILAFTPFDPERKRTEATVRLPGGQAFMVAKGAPQVILDLAHSSSRERERAQHAIEAFAARGYRSLAVARADIAGRWRLKGVIPLYDPLRPDAKQMVDAVRALGAEVKLLTGDQHAIGVEIAKAVGLDAPAMVAGQLASMGASPGQQRDQSQRDQQHQQHQQHQQDQQAQQIDQLVEGASAFTQVLPEHKYQIVEALQHRGHIVGMTGDGINDTPALRKADVGIAVSGSAEATRAASDLVLTQRGLMPLVEAIHESRRIFERMHTYAVYRVTETMRRLFALTLAVILLNLFPVTPTMLALLATFNAVVLIALAYDETRPSARPEIWRMDHVMYLASALGLASLVEFFGLYFYCERAIDMPEAQLQTTLFVALTAAGYFTLLIARTRGPFWSQRPAPVLLVAIVVALGLSLAIAGLGWFMAPISWLWILAVVGYSAAWFLVGDLIKLAVYRLLRALDNHPAWVSFFSRLFSSWRRPWRKLPKNP